MDDINLPTLFCLHFIKGWGSSPQIRFKTQVLLVQVYKIVSYFYYNYVSNVYDLYTIKSYAKIIPKLGLTLSYKKSLNFSIKVMQPILFVFI